MADPNSHSNGLSNGFSNGQTSTSRRRPLITGIAAPLMTFFKEDESVDVEALDTHVVRLAKAGLVVMVAMGSNGEAVHLSLEERILIIKTIRKALDREGFTHIPIIAGATEGSVRGTIALTQAFYDAGADYAIILPASYFRGQMNEDAIFQYFIDVANESPLPIVVYNYPGAVSGIDLDSDFLIRLRKAHQNIIGTKFTCANTGKLTRVASAVNAATPFNGGGSGYFAFGGICDFTAQTLVSGGSGIIAGGANVMPKVCVKVWNLYCEGKYDECFAMQKILSKGDWVLTKAAIAGTKSAIQSHFGYGGHPRRPLQRLDKIGVQKIEEGIEEVMKLEKELPDIA